MVYFILAFLISTAMMPLIIKICERFSLYDYINQRKIHSGKIPRLGGIGIVLAFFVSSWIFFNYKLKTDQCSLLFLLFATFILFIFDILDDVFNFHAVIKLLPQITACVIVIAGDYRFIQIFGYPVFYGFSIFFSFFWILILINAFNLIDGMDGLCGSLSFFILLAIGIINHKSDLQISTLCFILAASILGFLIFNKPTAKIFMGDCGSQFLGFAIAVFPFLPSSEKYASNEFLMMIVLTSIPVFDTVAAIWRRIRDKKPIMQGDCFHLHHKLIRITGSKIKTLVIIDAVQILICATVIFSVNLNDFQQLLLLSGDLFFVLLMFSIIHFSHKKKLLMSGNKGSQE